MPNDIFDQIAEEAGWKKPGEEAQTENIVQNEGQNQAPGENGAKNEGHENAQAKQNDAGNEGGKPPEEKIPEEKKFSLLTELQARTGREFKDEDEIGKFFETYGSLEKELTERKSRDAYYQELESTFKDIVDVYDPIKQHGSEENWKRYETAKQIGQGKNQFVVSEVVNKDLSKIDNLSVTAMGAMFNSTDITLEEAKRSVLRKIGVDIKGIEEETGKPFDMDSYTLTPEQKVDLSIMASSSRDNFEKLKAGVKFPEIPDFKKNIDAKAQERLRLKGEIEQKWGNYAKKLAEEPPKIQFFEAKDGKEQVAFEVDYSKLDKKFMAEAIELVHKDAVLRNVEPTDENVGIQNELFKMYVLYKNYQKITNAILEDKLSAQQEKTDNEIYNSQPINKTEAPQSTGALTKQEKANAGAKAMLEAEGLL